MSHFDPESVDLAAVTAFLQEACGEVSLGAVAGRTQLRDEVVRRLGCSLLQGEGLIDTMIGRGFIKREEDSLGMVKWVLVAK